VLPLLYRGSGLQNPADDPVLEEVFGALPSQPCSQNNVLNPVVQPLPPIATAVSHVGGYAMGATPCPSGGDVAPHASNFVVVAAPPLNNWNIAPPPSGGTIVALPASAPVVGTFAVAAPPGGIANKWARLTMRNAQRQMAAAAVSEYDFQFHTTSVCFS